MEFQRCRSRIKNWWALMLMGIVFIAVGIISLFYPSETYVILSVLFGAMVLASGVMEIFIGAVSPKKSGRGWIVAAGIIESLLGIVLLSLPQVLISVLPYVLGFWIMFRGFTMVGMASDMMDYGIKGSGWSLTLAILLILASFVILINPVIGAGAIILWIGATLILAGISMIVYSIYMKRMAKHL